MIEFEDFDGGVTTIETKTDDNGYRDDDEIKEDRMRPIGLKEGSIVELAVDPATHEVTASVDADSFTFSTLFPEGAWSKFPVYGYIKTSGGVGTEFELLYSE